MKVCVKYFASIREALACSSETIDTTAPTLGALRDALIAQGGAYAQALARGQAVRMARNQVMADEASTLTDGDEVAFFPPVTGG
jgi:sulfur-carrier protein